MNHPHPSDPRDAMQNGNYLLAFEMYQERFKELYETFSPADLLTGAYCASRCGKYAKGHSWVDKVLANHPENEKAKETKAWLIFREVYTERQSCPLEKQIEALNQLIELNAGDSAQILPAKAAIATCAQLLALKSPPYLTMVKWIRAINPEGLRVFPVEHKLPDGTIQSHPSDLERYMTLVCNIYFKGEYFEECYKACNELLSRFPAPHYGNAIWIKRKMAYCLAATGQYEAAANIYKSISEGQPVWFILFEYARVLVQLDKKSLAGSILAKAMLTPGPIAVKVHLVGYYARFLSESGLTEMAARHTQLHKAIYNEKNWIKPTEYENSLNDSQTDDTENTMAKDLIKLLKPWWKNQMGQMPAMLNGKIIKMNPGNLSGFIKPENGSSLYFSIADWMSDNQPPQVHQSVKFAIARKMNKKTQRENDVAILVSPIN